MSVATIETFGRILVQRTLNETLGIELKRDGAFGPATSKALSAYQEKFNLEITGKLDEPTKLLVDEYADKRFVTIQKLVDAAGELGVDPAMVLSLWETESVGEGFLTNGLCVILFERHQFYKYAKQRLGGNQVEAWRKTSPDLCHPIWDASVYEGGKGEWERLGRAVALDATCALIATSWGLFQTMGFNYGLAGYDDVQGMVEAFQNSENAHLGGFVSFVNSLPKLKAAIEAKDFKTVARIYNGPGYAANQYDVKLENNHDKWTNLLG